MTASRRTATSRDHAQETIRLVMELQRLERYLKWAWRYALQDGEIERIDALVAASRHIEYARLALMDHLTDR